MKNSVSELNGRKNSFHFPLRGQKKSFFTFFSGLGFRIFNENLEETNELFWSEIYKNHEQIFASTLLRLESLIFFNFLFKILTCFSIFWYNFRNVKSISLSQQRNDLKSHIAKQQTA